MEATKHNREDNMNFVVRPQELVGKKFKRHGRIFTVIAMDGPQDYEARVRMADGTEYFFPPMNVAYYVKTAEVK